MKISLKWLKEFVDVSASPQKLARKLRGIGLNVEAIESSGDGTVLEIEITTNRPDCLNHYGVARELAAACRGRLKPLEIKLRETRTPARKEASIKIADPRLCHRYCGRVIRNVHVGPSPKWLAKRLEAVGVRAINNVTDVTNYVLMELGHPLHAFNLDRLEGKKIIVRRAQNGETLRTLDGENRELTRDALVIADRERPVALAGIMGGEETGISDGTHSVLLESAWFDPVSIRFTARRQGLRSEASYRFERGADIEMAPRAIDRAAELIAQLAGGEVLKGILDVYPTRRRPPRISLTEKEIVRLLGMQPSRKEIERILRSLGFQAKAGAGGSWQVTPPSFRPDIGSTVDLVEEVARHVGYDNLPSRLRPAPPRIERNTAREFDLRLYERLTGLGYGEIITYPMVDPEENARFTDRPPVPLENPLSQEASVMRSSPLPGMLRALKWNLDRDRKNLQLFEKGKTYTARSKGKGLPEERWVLTLGLTGGRRLPSVHESSREADYFDLKGDIESLIEIFSATPLEWGSGAPGYFDRNRSARLLARGETLAVCGRLDLSIETEYKLRQPVLIAEIGLERLITWGLTSPRFRSFSRFPALERDFSLTVPDGTSYGEIAQAIERTGIREIRSVQPLDHFPGGEGTKSSSLLVRVSFQSADRTLTSDEITQSSRKILDALEAISVRIRSA